MTQVHVDPTPIPLLKIKYYSKSDTYFVKLKLIRALTSSTSDLSKLKISLFYNVYPEEFFLFVRNSSMTLVTLGNLWAGVKV